MSAGLPPKLPEVRDGPARGKVLVVAPHPDDETMGLGGTLALHADAGDIISALFVGSGIQGDPDGHYPREDYARIRSEEAHAAARVLGISDLRFLGYPDNLDDEGIHVFGNLPKDPVLARQALAGSFAEMLGDILTREQFSIVYYPWEGELHADHWQVSLGVRTLMATRADLLERIDFLGYDVWTALPPDTVIDTSDVMARKLAAVKCYASQLLYQDYEHAVLGLDAYRSLLLERGASYGEAFVGRYRQRGQS
jgi:LmbE family N-acetylglucosaminyl deacetylase